MLKLKNSVKLTFSIFHQSCFHEIFFNSERISVFPILLHWKKIRQIKYNLVFSNFFSKTVTFTIFLKKGAYFYQYASQNVYLFQSATLKWRNTNNLWKSFTSKDIEWTRDARLFQSFRAFSFSIAGEQDGRLF